MFSYGVGANFDGVVRFRWVFTLFIDMILNQFYMHIGFLIDFVSGPVSSGFTSAAALIIVTSQVKDLFGIQASGNTFVDTWRSIFHDIANIRMWDTVLGIACIVILLMLRVTFH